MWLLVGLCLAGCVQSSQPVTTPEPPEPEVIELSWSMTAQLTGDDRDHPIFARVGPRLMFHAPPGFLATELTVTPSAEIGFEAHLHCTSDSGACGTSTSSGEEVLFQFPPATGVALRSEHVRTDGLILVDQIEFQGTLTGVAGNTTKTVQPLSWTGSAPCADAPCLAHVGNGWRAVIEATDFIHSLQLNVTWTGGEQLRLMLYCAAGPTQCAGAAHHMDTTHNGPFHLDIDMYSPGETYILDVFADAGLTPIGAPVGLPIDFTIEGALATAATREAS